ncbi:MAG: hypothetical protein EBT57_03635 [Verrucomicrobia bacterium]|nr:hypothetical protein [Verrucomicrobiota bacterium]
MKSGSAHSPAFSLVEVALSLAILAVGMVGVLALLPVGLDSARQVHMETIATSLVRSAIGDLCTNAWSPTGFAQISQTAPANQYYAGEGQLLAKPDQAVFVLQFQKVTNNANFCRYFLNLAWPYAAWAAKTNSPLIQRRTFVVDVVKNF